MSDELEHAYVHAHTVTVDVYVLQKVQAAAVVSGAPCSWWARKQLAAFSTTKEIVVDCKLAVAVPHYSH